VSIIGAHIAPKVSGVQPGDRGAARARRVRTGPDGVERPEDLVEITDPSDTVRGLEGNDQEEAHEDRQAHQQYTPGGFVKRAGTTRSLDIQG
jgi:hypothetical protein